MTLHWDIETRSHLSLKDVGVHVYSCHPSTEILCAVISDGVQSWTARYPEMSCPSEVADRLKSGERLVAHNAQFETAHLKNLLVPRHGWPDVDIAQTDCTMARAAAMALPLGLGEVCKVLGLPFQKDDKGRRLMLQMTKVDRKGEWVFSEEKLNRLIEYCRADVLAEMSLDKVLRPLSPSEREVWEVDQAINNRGVAVDVPFVHAAIARANTVTADLNARMAEITAGVVPVVTAAAKLRDWAKANGVIFPTVIKRPGQDDEYEAETSDKATLTELLRGDLRDDIRLAFELRLEGAKSSVRKLVKFRDYASVDGRARGTLQYHAASTGRWGGRGIQLQNVVRMPDGFDWDANRSNLDDCDLPTLSKMLRGAIVAAPGKKLVWGDYSAVEARGVVWAAKQTDIVDVFATGQDVYKHMAGLIFGKDPQNVTKDERFIGKTSVLGCGYGVGPAKFQAQCGRMGQPVSDELARQAVGGWREANHKVVELWRTLETAAKTAIQAPGTVVHAGICAFRMVDGYLLLRLPSGRLLHYAAAKLVDGKFGKVIGFMAISPWTKQWSLQTTWGGSVLNNLVQAFCRDFTAKAMVTLENSGAPVVLSVHDEIVVEVERNFPLDKMRETMTLLPSWAAGFPLKADVDEGERYGK